MADSRKELLESHWRELEALEEKRTEWLAEWEKERQTVLARHRRERGSLCWSYPCEVLSQKTKGKRCISGFSVVRGSTWHLRFRGGTASSSWLCHPSDPTSMKKGCQLTKHAFSTSFPTKMTSKPEMTSRSVELFFVLLEFNFVVKQLAM